MAVAFVAGFPKISTVTFGVKTASVGPYNVPDGAVLLAWGGSQTNQQCALSDVVSGGGSIVWTSLRRLTSGGRAIELFQGTVSAGGATGVTTTVTVTNSDGLGLIVAALSGALQALPTPVAAAGNSSNGARVTISVSTIGSMLVGSFFEDATLTNPTPLSGCTSSVHAGTNNGAIAEVHSTVPTVATGPFALGISSPLSSAWVIVGVEVLPGPTPAVVVATPIFEPVPIWLVSRPRPSSTLDDPSIVPVWPARVAAAGAVVCAGVRPGSARGAALVGAATGSARLLAGDWVTSRAASVTAKCAGSRFTLRELDPSPEMLGVLLKLLAGEPTSINRRRAVVVQAADAIAAAAKDFLLRGRLAVAGAARAQKLAKASVATAKASEEEEEDEAVRAIDQLDFTPLADAVKPELRKVAADGAAEGLHQVTEPLDAMLSQANAKAIAWADAHAAELVTQVKETTREAVRLYVEQALEEGWSNDELGDAIEEDAAFSPARAEVIARTETAYADVQGNLIGWSESGVVAEKQWIVADANECSDCADLDGAVVALDEAFADGVDGPPLHPNCRCDVLPVLSAGEEE